VAIVSIRRTPRHPLRHRLLTGFGAAAAMVVLLTVQAPTSGAAPSMAAGTAAAACTPGQSGAAVPTPSRGDAAIRTMIGVAKTMQVPYGGEIIAVMVMLQESSIRNLANDGSSPSQSFPAPGRDYWLSVTRLSLKYPHDMFGSLDGAHDTDSIGLYQQRPAWGWGDYGNSTGRTDPEGVVQRLLDPRWESMAFFGGNRSASNNSGLLDIVGWESMALTDAAEAVQGSTQGDLYAKWEDLARQKIQALHDSSPAIDLPWYPGGGGGALACTSVPSDPRLGEAGRNPIGTIDLLELRGNQTHIAGWAIDRDAINGVVAIYASDNSRWGIVWHTAGLANQSRPDVARAFNFMGNFGYDFTVPWTGPGPHEICLTAINIGRGTGNQSLGCRTVTVPEPTGSLDRAAKTASGQIAVGGWAADPASPGVRADVHIYVFAPKATNGTAITTGVYRPDVGRAVPWAGNNTGFSAEVPNMGSGDNQVCAFAVNVLPPQTNPLIGCRTVRIPYSPVGTIDSIDVTGTSATVSGWAYDPTTPQDSIPVRISVTPGGSSAFTANDPRPDVNAALGITGQHGFSRVVRLSPGYNSICTFGISTTTADDTLLGCYGATSGPAALTVPDGRDSDGTSSVPSPASPPTIDPLPSTGSTGAGRDGPATSIATDSPGTVPNTTGSRAVPTSGAPLLDPQPETGSTGSVLGFVEQEPSTASITSGP
jgi:hypothetical protein